MRKTPLPMRREPSAYSAPWCGATCCWHCAGKRSVDLAVFLRHRRQPVPRSASARRWACCAHHRARRIMGGGSAGGDAVAESSVRRRLRRRHPGRCCSPPAPLGMLVMGKIAAHWLVAGLPLVLIAPLLGLQYDLAPRALGGAGAVAADRHALAEPDRGHRRGADAGVRGGGVLLSLLTLPLYIPALIFGAGAVEADISGLGAAGHLSLLAALLALAGFFARGQPRRHYASHLNKDLNMQNKLIQWFKYGSPQSFIRWRESWCRGSWRWPWLSASPACGWVFCGADRSQG